MLTDIALKKLKPKDKLYKVADRDGMYIAMAPSGQITFRYDYRLNGRRETLTIGRYGADGVSLSEARDRCLAARERDIGGALTCTGEAARKSQARHFPELWRCRQALVQGRSDGREHSLCAPGDL